MGNTQQANLSELLQIVAGALSAAAYKPKALEANPERSRGGKRQAPKTCAPYSFTRRDPDYYVKAATCIQNYLAEVVRMCAHARVPEDLQRQILAIAAGITRELKPTLESNSKEKALNAGHLREMGYKVDDDWLHFQPAFERLDNRYGAQLVEMGDAVAADLMLVRGGADELIDITHSAEIMGIDAKTIRDRLKKNSIATQPSPNRGNAKSAKLSEIVRVFPEPKYQKQIEKLRDYFRAQR